MYCITCNSPSATDIIAVYRDTYYYVTLVDLWTNSFDSGTFASSIIMVASKLHDLQKHIDITIFAARPWLRGERTRQYYMPDRLATPSNEYSPNGSLRAMNYVL